jgi:hypothetical protein
MHHKYIQILDTHTNTRMLIHTSMNVRHTYMDAYITYVRMPTHMCLHAYRRMQIHMDASCKLTIFQWLIVHRSVAVGTWLSKAGHNPSCKLCGHEQETQYHCLWGCTKTAYMGFSSLVLFRSRSDDI